MNEPVFAAVPQAPDSATPATTSSNDVSAMGNGQEAILKISGEVNHLAGFFRLNLASAIYVLSALAVLYGLIDIIHPVLAKSFIFAELLPCYATLKLYESALFAAALGIVLLRAAVRDAVSLAILFALFLGAGALLLACIANDAPGLAPYLAAGALAVFALEFRALRLFLITASQRADAAVSALAFAGMSIVPAITAHRIAGSPELHDTFIAVAWGLGWVPFAAGALWLFTRCLACPTGGIAAEIPGTPFLRRPAMPQLFAFVLLAMAGVSQYAGSYVFFTVPLASRYCFPYVVLLSFLLLELLRSHHRHGAEWANALLVIPVILAMAAKNQLTGAEQGFELLGRHEPLLALATILAMLHLRRVNQPSLYLVPAAYLGMLAFTFGLRRYEELNALYGFAYIFTIVSCLAVWRKSANLLFFALFLASLGLAAKSGSMRDWLYWINLNAGEQLLVCVGLSLLVPALVFHKQRLLGMAFVGAGLVAATLIYGGQWNYSGNHWLAESVKCGFALVLALLIFWRGLGWCSALAALSPLFVRLHALVDLPGGWVFVALGFLLLGVGVWISLRYSQTSGQQPKQPSDQQSGQLSGQLPAQLSDQLSGLLSSKLSGQPSGQPSGQLLAQQYGQQPGRQTGLQPDSSSVPSS